MIFSGELASKVLAGRKTETRRRIKPRESNCRYRPGRDYAVQAGRGGKALARIEIIAVARQPLAEITQASARREGFDDVEAFGDYWAELYGSIDWQEPVWAIAFGLAEPIRLLARHSEHSYTRDPHMALEDEPEAPDPTEIADYAPSRQARERFEDERRATKVEREVRALALQTRAKLLDAHRQGVDVEPLITSWRQDLAGLG